MVWLLNGEKKFEDTFIHFDTIHERGGHQTDRQTDNGRRHRPRLCRHRAAKTVVVTLPEQSSVYYECERAHKQVMVQVGADMPTWTIHSTCVC